MDGFAGKPASFFKIFFRDFSSKLRIPPEFVKKCGEILRQISLLEAESGKYFWDVKIKYINEHFYLTDGWPEFVKDNHLTENDFLLFKLVSKSTFQVSVYGMDGCPKEPSSSASPNSQTSGEDIELLPKVVSKEENYESNRELSGSKSFPALIKEHCKYCMDIPKNFAIETGIAKKNAIKLRNVEGKEWDVEILMMKDGGIRLSRGWYEFRLRNQLVCGSKCWFQFDSTSGNLIMKREWDITNKSSAKRRRGRPHKHIVVPAKSSSIC